jgi:hypothetical protein
MKTAERISKFSPSKRFLNHFSTATRSLTKIDDFKLIQSLYQNGEILANFIEVPLSGGQNF